MKIMLLLLVLISSLTHTVIDSQQRAPQMTKLLRYRRDGDVVIAGIFLFHEYFISDEYVDNLCGNFDIYSYPYAQAMMFAIQNANRDPQVLPNITVGFEVYDSCGNAFKCLESTFWFLSGKSKEFPNYECQSSSAAVSMVAEVLPENSIAVAQVLGLYRFPQPPRSVCSESCSPGFRKVTQPGKPACCYVCTLCAEGEIANQSDSTDCLTCKAEEWPNERKDKCIQRSTEFLSYNEPLGVALTSITIMGFLLTAYILVVFVRFNDTPIVKANNQNLSYLLLIALILCFMCSFMFIGYPTELTCRLRQAVFGISFVLSISCILAKTIMVVVAFNATKPNSKFRRWVGPQLSYTTVALCTVIQVIICITWTVCFSPFPEYNFKFQPGMIIIECNEGSTIAFWGMLGYMGVLAGTCFVVAFLSRNLPDSFNESKFISFSMIVFVSVWLGFIPAYLSTKGKYMVAVEVFAIIASSAGLLACIFFPKCFIILMRPDMNTKVYLMGKETKSR